MIPAIKRTAASAVATASQKQKYVPQDPHTPPADAEAFLASLDPMNRRLHEIAVDKLGSSYIMEWTHGYKAWKKTASTGSPQAAGLISNQLSSHPGH